MSYLFWSFKLKSASFLSGVLTIDNRALCRVDDECNADPRPPVWMSHWTSTKCGAVQHARCQAARMKTPSSAGRVWTERKTRKPLSSSPKTPGVGTRREIFVSVRVDVPGHKELCVHCICNRNSEDMTKCSKQMFPGVYQNESFYASTAFTRNQLAPATNVYTRLRNLYK